MQYTIPQFVLMIVAFAIYLIKPRWLMLLWLITTPFLGPFIVMFSGATDFEDQMKIVWTNWGVFNLVFLLIIFIEIAIKLKWFYKNIFLLTIPVVLLIIYIVFHNFITHFYPPAILRETISIIYTLVPLFALLLDKELWPSLKELYIVAFVICLVQLIFIPLNLQGIYAYTGRYQELLKGSLENDLMPGTFTRSNMMADYLCAIYLFVTLDFFYRKSLSIIHYIVISIIIFIPLLYAGSKAPVVSAIVCFFLCIATFNKKNLPIVIGAFLLAVGLFSFLASNKNESISSNEGLNRVVNEMGGLVQSGTQKNTQNETTLQYSTDLINKYFWDSPIVGHGNAYEEDENNSYNSTLTLSNLKSDATLAFYLVEYGVIGLLAFLFFQYKVLKFSAFSVPIKQRKLVVFVIFTTFFFMAFTERGLFDKNYFIFTFVYLFGLARFNEENHGFVNQINK